MAMKIDKSTSMIKKNIKAIFKNSTEFLKIKKKSLDEIKSRLDTVEKNISEHEAIAIEIIHNEHRKKCQNKQSFCKIWDNFKQSIIYVIEIPVGYERDGGIKKICRNNDLHVS